MTVQTTTSRADYTGNGTTTAFAVPFYFLDNTHIKVLRTQVSTGVATTLTLTTDYTVTGAGVVTGGTVTCVAAPTSDQKLSILRNVPFTQLVDYVENDPFPANTHERALDQLTMETQQLNEEISRALTLPENSTGVSTALPTPFANNVIGWNATATGLQNVDQATLATLVASGTARADIFTGDGVTTAFTLTSNPGNQASLDVSVGGVTQLPGTDYIWTSGTLLTFTTAPVLGVKVLAKYWLGLPQNYSDSATTTFSHAVTYGQGTVGLALQNMINVKNAPYNVVGDGIADDTAGIQAAVNAAIARSIAIGNYALAAIYIPAGIYKISSTIKTQGSPTTGQCAIRGDGHFLTVIKPTGDFTAINIANSYIDSGDFSIEWAAQDAATIPATRIGIELASGDRQWALTTLRNVQVRGAYRGYVLNDWTGQPLGTTWLASLEKCHAIRCADWGIWINSKTGSTTMRLMQCYVRAENAVGGAQYGKGIYINNVNEILFEQCAIDQCLNQWMELVNYNVAVFNSIAFEANRMSSAAAVAMQLNGSQNVINGFKDIVNVFDTGGNARVIFMGGNARTLAISGYNEQSSTVAGGTTKYRIGFNAATSLVSVLDRSVVPSQVLNNGWVINAVYEGRRLSVSGVAPSYGTWLRGDYVVNGAPAVGSPKGWYCTVAGTPGTWVSEGNL